MVDLQRMQTRRTWTDMLGLVERLDERATGRMMV